jgi:hypothetical protein
MTYNPEKYERPNLFELATKELSQDGFIAWLLLWANPSNKKHDEKLNVCAAGFARLLIGKKDLEITKVEAGRQRDKIDVWAKINDKYLIIIEDKIDTSEHGNQLKRYREAASKWYPEEKLELICIYLKTGTESKSSIEKIRSKEFKYISRSDLINFFKNYNGIKNNIYIDFTEKIINAEAAEKAFETKMIKDWDWNCWIGFYNYLDSKLEIVGWEYVPNKKGGFLGLWWHWQVWKKYEVYLQIEQNNFCFKIGVGPAKENCKDAREKWQRILMAKAKEKNRNEIIKPARLGSGKWMTVAIVKQKDWLGSDDEIIDLKKVIVRLKEYEKFLENSIGG